MITETLSCGTKVKIILSDTVALITGITIRENRIMYEVSYFYNGDYKNFWVSDYEFTVLDNKESIKIGFRK